MTDLTQTEKKEIATRATVRLMAILVSHGKDLLKSSKTEQALWFDLFKEGMELGLKEAKEIVNTTNTPTT